MLSSWVLPTDMLISHLWEARQLPSLGKQWQKYTEKDEKVFCKKKKKISSWGRDRVSMSNPFQTSSFWTVTPPKGFGRSREARAFNNRSQKRMNRSHIKTHTKWLKNMMSCYDGSPPPTLPIPTYLEWLCLAAAALNTSAQPAHSSEVPVLSGR